jgi:hypothetical protein
MTQRYKFLSFHDKSGNDLNFFYDDIEGAWIGDIYIPEVSVGLYETINMFIVEEFITTSNIKKFGKPHISNPNLSNTDGDKWILTWMDDTLATPEAESDFNTDDTKSISMYQFNADLEKPVIQMLETLEVQVDVDPAQTADLVTGQIITNIIISESIQVNISLNSEDEAILERTLLIKEKESGILIAKINFYGETVAEDERFSTELLRLGMDIGEDEFPIFRNSDINEYRPDFEILNNKRKEMLIEGRNIIPFIGAYKGLINAIKFYGYDNIKIREFWLNIDKESINYGKYNMTDVLDIFDSNVDLNDTSFQLPNKIYKKTNLFSLVYRLNEITAEENEDDLPVVRELFEFTSEEILIKLYGLKNILKKKYLSGNSRIVDIVGEADYFTKMTTTLWSDTQNIFKIKVGINPCFTVSPSNEGYIQDLRTTEDILFPSATPYLLDPAMTADSQIKAFEIADVLLAYFNDYGPNLDTVAELPDKPGIPVGYPIVLNNCSFDTTWDKAEIQWNELSATGNLILDFEPTVFGSGDTMIIKDRFSNEQVSYVVQFGDSKQTIVNNLYSQILVAAGTDDGKPWSYYEITKEDKNNDTQFDTIRFRQIFTANIGVEFNGITIDGGVPGNKPVMEKKIATGNTTNTWNTFGIGNFYEIEWVITKDATDTQPAYNYTVRGDIGDFSKIAFALPYIGTYNVEMRLYDTFNQMSSKIQKDFITVNIKNVEFAGFYKFQEREYTWDSSTTKEVSWDYYSSDWELPIVPQSDTWEGNARLYEALDRANYILNNTNPDQQLSYHFSNPEAPILNILYTPGPYQWDNLGIANWNEAYHLWWNSTKISGDTPANFRIYAIDFGEQLLIEQVLPFESVGIHIFNTNDLETAAAELNNSTDPVIKKYIYNPVHELNTDGENVVFIQGVARNFGRNGDWTTLEWTTGIDIRYQQLHETNNPTYNNIRFLNDGKVLPKLTHLTFTYDMCTIPGKDKPEWHLVNIDSPQTDNIYFTGRWFTYLFKRAGRYTLDLTLEDSNGNKNSVSRNIILIK